MLTRAKSSAAACGRASTSRKLQVVVRAQKQQQEAKPLLAQMVRPATLTAVANIIAAMPAAAEGGKLFDFNLTLPIMAGEFLLLMVFLDKFWFGPVGKVLDERDALIRSKLATVKDGGNELNELAAQAEAILKEARSEVSKMLNSSKAAKQAELDKIYNDAKAKVTAETEGAIASMEKESAGLLAKMDAQVDTITQQVLKVLLPKESKVSI